MTEGSLIKLALETASNSNYIKLNRLANSNYSVTNKQVQGSSPIILYYYSTQDLFELGARDI